MREDLLHFVWKYKKLQLLDMVTTQNETLTIVDVGSHNHLAGPDFFNAKIIIDGQLWAGNIEIHINGSDWFTHHHEKDVNYENVILHVVWKDDMVVFRRDKTIIPTLELSHYVPETILRNYQNLFEKQRSKFINCENEISNIDGFTIANWLERLYIERLEQKSILINQLLITSKNDWENVLFTLLLKNFGLKINSGSFYSLAHCLDYSIVRKLQKNPFQLESVLLGLAGLLNHDSKLDTYHDSLMTEYMYLKNKFGITEEAVQKPEFFKLRPANFPTIRLSQIANVYGRHQNLFQMMISTRSLAELYAIFNISASEYWDTHFTFGKESRKSTKRLTKKFIDLLIINTIIPIKFCYARSLGKNPDESILSIIDSIKQEENNILKKFTGLGLKSKTAGESQAILQLYNQYCTKNKCLECAIGSSLLNGNI